MTKGVIYSCAGNIRFLRESIKSAESVKKFMPNINICLFHNYSDTMLNSVDVAVFTEVRKIVLPDNNDPKFNGHMGCFLAKLYSIQQTPYDYTLFLDTDTEIKRRLPTFFDLLKNFDIAIAPGPMTQPPKNSDDIINLIPDEFPELNTGVILYKKSEKMDKFLNTWKETFLHNINGLYREHGKGGEQVALRYLLWSHQSIRMHIFSTTGIPNMFNFRWGPTNKQFSFEHKVAIHHTRYK